MTALTDEARETLYTDAYDEAYELDSFPDAEMHQIAHTAGLRAVFAAGAADMQERAAVEADSYNVMDASTIDYDAGWNRAAEVIAAAIRALGTTTGQETE